MNPRRVSIFLLILFPYLLTRRIFGLVFGRSKRNELFQTAGLGSTWDYLRKLGIPSSTGNWIDLKTRFGYEPEVTDFVSRIWGRVFYDIGAGTGHYSVLLSRNFETIVAFEPDLRNFQHIIYAAMVGRLTNIRVSKVAISDFDGTATLRRSGVLWHSIVRATQEDRELLVSTTKLDSIIGQKTIDLVKVDVEGAEWHVLRGAEKSMRAGKIRRILIELHDAGRKDELERYLRQRSYSTVWLDHNHVFGEIVSASPSTGNTNETSKVKEKGATPKGDLYELRPG